MGMKSTPTTTTQNTSSYIPSWLTGLSLQAGAQGQNLPQYTPYTGPNTQAGLQSNQLQAGDIASSSAGVPNMVASSSLPAYLNGLNFSMPQVGAGTVNNITSGLLGAQSPILQQEIGAAQQAGANTQAINTGQMDTNLAAQHAFGGDRQALADANIGAQTAIGTNQQIAGLLGQAGQGAQNAAVNIAQGNQNAAATGEGLNLNAAGGLNSLAGNLQGLTNSQIGNLASTGQTAQNTQSGQNQFNWQQYLEGYQIPDTQATTFASILGALPHDTTGTSTTQSQMYTNPLMQAAGLGLGLFAKSDRRIKKDIQEVGCLFDGTPVYRFRYVNSDTDTWHIGLMAQDVEEEMPAAVREFGGIKHVDYKLATDHSALLYIETALADEVEA